MAEEHSDRKWTHLRYAGPNSGRTLKNTSISTQTNEVPSTRLRRRVSSSPRPPLRLFDAYVWVAWWDRYFSYEIGFSLFRFQRSTFKEKNSTTIQNMRFQNIILENTYVGIETQNTHGKISNFSNKKIKYLFRGWEYDRMGFYIIQTNSNKNLNKNLNNYKSSKNKNTNNFYNEQK